jgi:phage baseplate assembly protein W
MANPLIGKGWAFPVQIDGRGGIALASDQTDLDQAIQIILGTRIGERVMRPDFGCRIHDLTFAPINGQTLGLVQRYVEEAIGWWEPRVELMEVEVTTDPSMRSSGKLLIQVRYRVRTTKDERSLVYPFYLISPEE